MNIILIENYQAINAILAILAIIDQLGAWPCNIGRNAVLSPAGARGAIRSRSLANDLGTMVP
jgi:hypothetical protein